MILVTGVPRSGTSAVSGVLHHLGIPMGRSTPGDEWNAKGYYHDLDFEGAIQEILRYPFPKFGAFVECPAISNIAKKRSGLWGFKSNRICYCLPSLLDAVDEVKIITTYRPLDESIQSYSARSRIPLDAADKQIKNVAEAIEKTINPGLIVPYHNLLDSPVEWVGKIADFVSLPVRQEAIKWIDKDLRRFKS